MMKKNKWMIILASLVTISPMFVGLILFFINGNRTVREELRRRVHF